MVWDADNGGEILNLKENENWLTSMAFSPDGKRLVGGGNDNRAKGLGRGTLGKTILTLKRHSGAITGVAYSPDGKRFVSSSQDNTMKLWDADKGTEILTLKGHTDAVTCVAFSPDGKRLVSGSADETVNGMGFGQGLRDSHFQRAHRIDHLCRRSARMAPRLSVAAPTAR